MKAIRVKFDNGSQLETNCTGSDAEIKDYYLNKEFNISATEYDLMAVAIEVEILS